jgi:hypothetical protein
MVHCGGHSPGVQRRAASGWQPGRTALVIAALGVSLALPAPAAAQQAVGFYGGATVDPEQAYGGVFWQSGDIFGGLRLRPGIDGGVGEGLRIASINFDFVYGFALGLSGWTLYQGGGPSVVITRWPDFEESDTSVGAHYLFGFGHDSGFFSEIRLGSGNAQTFSIGVGWAITLN